jgi:hypothetical protein
MYYTHNENIKVSLKRTVPSLESRCPPLFFNTRIFWPEGADDFRSVARSRVGRLMFNMTRKVMLTGELCTVGITVISPSYCTVQEN